MSSAEEGRRSAAADLGTESEVRACAACGKTGDRLKRCTGCRSVRYCDVHCQRLHRKVHEAECKRRGAELKMETVSPHPADAKEESASPDSNPYFDEGYTPPPRPECPICMLTLPLANDRSTYMACCGKTICDGCVFEGVRVAIETGKKSGKTREELREESRLPCSFCRAPFPTPTVELERLKKRGALADPQGIFELGGHYLNGDITGEEVERKGLELLHRSADLGYPLAAYTLGRTYAFGEYSVQPDEEKAQEYFEKAAQGGYPDAHIPLALKEMKRGNNSAAFSHLRIAVSAGHEPALEAIKLGYREGDVSKDDLATSLRAFQLAQDELKSDTRDRLQKQIERSRTTRN